MRYLLLPIHLIDFWYFESLIFFVRTWKNTILFLEEDLAVGLMLKLLFVPLFHDSSIVGSLLSFIFRIIRIFIGLVAFSLATILIIFIALFWLFSPIMLIFGIQIWFNLILVFSGVGIFLIHTFSHPHKKIWQIKNGNLWESSYISRTKLNWANLLKTEEVKEYLNYLENSPQNFTNFQITDTEAVVKTAFDLTKKMGSDYLTAMYFFVAVLKNNPGLEEFLLKFNLTEQDLEDNLDYLQKRRDLWRVVYIWDSDFTIHHLRGTNRGWLGSPTSTLDQYSTDLTREASKGFLGQFFGREKIVSEVVDILSQNSNKNVILVGSAGSGKTSLIDFLAAKIVSGDAPTALATKRIVAFDLTKLLSGVESQGDLADRVQSCLEEAQYAGNLIIVMEEIHNIALGQAGNEFNLYSLIEPFLDYGNFQFIATTEPENYSRILEKNGVFARLFTKVEVSPTNVEETTEILEQKAIALQRKNRIFITFLALKKIVDLSEKYIRDRVMPDSAISILEQSVGHLKVEWLTSKVAEEVVSERINIPVQDLGNVEKSELLNLETEISTKVIGQKIAIKAVSDALRRASVSIQGTSRPIGSFLFVGPTGVGKTELAKELAFTYFSDSNSKRAHSLELDSPTRSAQTVENLRQAETRPLNNNDNRGVFIRFDMSEYQGEDGLKKLIGSEGESGELTEKIKNKPYALLLLDEFEKADPKILTLFLQVLEDGRLTDGTGKTIDFTHTIIIATSNAASLTIAKGLASGENSKALEKKVREELLEIFKPELMNRFDEVVIFTPLSEEELEKIVIIKLEELKQTLRNQGYAITFNPDLISTLAKKGYDPVLGARPLRRLIQDTLESKLSRKILEGNIKKGEPMEVGLDYLTN